MTQLRGRFGLAVCTPLVRWIFEEGSRIYGADNFMMGPTVTAASAEAEAVVVGTMLEGIGLTVARGLRMAFFRNQAVSPVAAAEMAAKLGDVMTHQLLAPRVWKV